MQFCGQQENIARWAKRICAVLALKVVLVQKVWFPLSQFLNCVLPLSERGSTVENNRPSL
jgi:hypothetical protein